MSLFKLLFGRRLANEEYIERKIGAFEGVPAMGLDGLGSSSYGPEAAMTVLMPLGAIATAYIGLVMLPILALLAILYVSYRQTIRAYPNNGGAYVVSKLNLGTNLGLVAAAALMIDYVLNVAVGISAGVGALTSVVPSLHPYTLALCLLILFLVTILNLRGTVDAGRAWALPTYLFTISFILILAIGVHKTLAAGGRPPPVVPPTPLPDAREVVSIWLLLRSFAAGCTAMTGIEAVSNGVSAFREPAVQRAHRTLGAISTILGILLAGTTFLVWGYGIGAMDQTQDGYQSVLSQIAGAVIGHGIFYYLAMASALCILCLSANTSFVDFPRVCRLLAQDDFLPRPFAVVGRRLVFSVGILYLAAAAGLLLIAFRGITDRLIPLFAIGAFLTFTMSQLGMVVHWRRELKCARTDSYRREQQAGLLINAIGAAATGIALAIIIVAKFTEGAWITLLVIPCVIVLLKMVKRYYVELDAQLRDDGPLDLRDTRPPVVLVVTEKWNRLTDRALQFSLRLSPDVVAVHLTKLGGPDVREQRGHLRRKWSEDVEAPARRAGIRPPALVFLEARYRRIEGPLLQFVSETEKQHPERPIAVLIPEIVKEHWWQYLLHTHRAHRVRAALLRYGGSQVVVINVPWYLEEPHIEEGLEQE
ncbi:MAG: putative aminoacid/polyamine transporter, permease protein, partial [Bradyrhizobium sp.]|nr:putative aminoacid/polyamine transporter, permease protein [Bradyrhizobium sp.]